jgi:hypothetical protein
VHALFACMLCLLVNQNFVFMSGWQQTDVSALQARYSLPDAPALVKPAEFVDISKQYDAEVGVAAQTLCVVAVACSLGALSLPRRTPRVRVTWCSATFCSFNNLIVCGGCAEDASRCSMLPLLC